MRYLTKRALTHGFAMFYFGFIGALAGGADTVAFISILAFFAVIIAIGFAIASIRTLVKEDNKFFESEPEDKIRVYMFYRKPVYLISIIEVILIIILITGQLDNLSIIKRIFESAVFILFVMIIVGLGWIIDDTVSRNFNYNIYRASIKLAMKHKSDKRSKYFLLALRYYDKYLRRRFGLAIKNLEGIFNRYALMESGNKELFLASLPDSQEDAFEPLRVFTSRLNYANEDLLTSISNIQKLKDTVSIIIPVIALLITIIQIMFNI